MYPTFQSLMRQHGQAPLPRVQPSLMDFADGGVHAPSHSRIETPQRADGDIAYHVGEFWTAKQRQASSIHEVSYRACFKPQLPAFFIQAFSSVDSWVYDPFAGRGTTLIEAARLGRRIIANDINPISTIFTRGRIGVPDLADIQARLESLPAATAAAAEINVSMFYHPDTERELLSLKNYLSQRKAEHSEDDVDRWIRMVATNRLTGHSPGFFSVYTFPPNQAVSAERQIKINQQRGQTPPYRNTQAIILKKSRQLLAGLSADEKTNLRHAARSALMLNHDARHTPAIADNSVALTVTSPPFLDVVQYAQDNWLRCWFNEINVGDIEPNITMSKTLPQWSMVMAAVLSELYRITQPNGYVAFEVGEVRKGKIKLDETIVPLGVKAGFHCQGVMINAQNFTKTANLWGVANNAQGTNTNRIVVFQKPK